VRDTLFLLKPGFEDPAYPGQTFYCWHCVLMEGVIASFPELAQRLDVHRIAWPRPRAEVVALAGEKNPSLPALVLADNAADGLETVRFRGRRFVQGKGAILRALTVRHGIPAHIPDLEGDADTATRAPS
jgi:hypothetical protein